MKIRPELLLIPLFFVVPPPTVQAANLLDWYRAAMNHDPDLKVVQADHEIFKERVAVAEAQLWPLLSATAQQSKNDTDRRQAILSQTTRYSSSGYSVNLRAPLLRGINFYGYRSAEAQYEQSAEALRHERQQAGLRVVEAYFKTVTARNRRNALQEEMNYHSAKLSHARKAFDSGEGTRTDIDEAMANVDLVAVKEIQAINLLKTSEHTLSLLVGFKISAEELPDFDPGRLAGATMESFDFNKVMAANERQNPEQQTARQSVEVAGLEIEKSKAGHWPTLDLVAGRTFSDSESGNTIGSRYYTDSIGVQLSVPLYSGGGIEAGVRQAIATQDRTRYQLDSARQQLALEATRWIGAVSESGQRVRAMEQVVRSSEQMLLATEKGLKAGTRTSVDVLNARQKMAQAKMDRDDAREAFVLAYIRLKSVMGEFDETMVSVANAWLAARY